MDIRQISQISVAHILQCKNLVSPLDFQILFQKPLLCFYVQKSKTRNNTKTPQTATSAKKRRKNKTFNNKSKLQKYKYAQENPMVWALPHMNAWVGDLYLECFLRDDLGWDESFTAASHQPLEAQLMTHLTCWVCKNMNTLDEPLLALGIQHWAIIRGVS